ncbi:MAG: hypothetical protein ACP5VS_11165 [Desulfomonilaceae bacterium]
MTASQSTTQVFNLFDWTKGVHNQSPNPLFSINNTLFAGENIDITNTGLAVRNGASTISTLPVAGPVVHLSSIMFPTNRVNYLLAQTVDSSGSSKLFAALIGPDRPEPISWNEIRDLGTNANIVSVSALNDRAIITEGKACPPLVFSGGLDPTGLDWAVPLAVLLTTDNGTGWIDISDSVLDTDSETTANIGAMAPENLWIAICLDTPIVSGLFLDISIPVTSGATPVIETYSYDWSPILDIVDNTNHLTRSGVITWRSTPAETMRVATINNIEGHWLRIRLSNITTPGFSLNRILFQGPCQPLSRIGAGAPDSPLGFIYWDESARSAKDFTIEVQDFNYPSFARLNDAALENPQGMSPEDFIYIGYLTKFRAIELTPHNDYHNAEPSAIAGSYWNGAEWKDLGGFDDGSAEPVGTPFGKRGIIRWNTPEDWKPNRPIGSQYPYGYWIRVYVSSPLTPRTFISEAAIWPEYSPLKKHKFVMTVRDRVILCNRSDAGDLLEISRPLEEFGFSGADSASLRIGGAGEIVAAIEVFNQGFIAKTDDWYLLNGYSPSTFSIERAEAAGQAPVNNRVLVRAPHMEADSKNLMGLYYINQRGAWYFAGLKVYRISDQVSWWDSASRGMRLDLKNLSSACGAYWAPRNWIIWAVPMLTDFSEQPSNNRLIIYDLNLGAWLPPFTISACSLEPVSQCPFDGHRGRVAMLAGGYNGNVMELFGPDVCSDNNDPIVAWAETPWTHFGSPHIEKSLRLLSACSSPSRNSPLLSVEIFADGSLSGPDFVEFTKSVPSTEHDFTIDQKPLNIHGRFFKFRIQLGAGSTLYGLQASAHEIRQWGAM